MSQNIECNVKLWGDDVGVIAQMGHKIYFQYAHSFLESARSLSPLHLPFYNTVLETTQLTHFEGLAGVFADALPDTWGTKIVENYFLKYKQKSPYEISPLHKLLYMGDRGMGALEFYPCEGNTHQSMGESLEIAQLVAQSRKVLEGNINDVLPEIFRVSSDSLGGAKAKATVGLNIKKHTIITANRALPNDFEHWMIKFDGMTEHGETTYKLIEEKIFLDMAEKCHINTVESILLEERGLSHLAVKRFDRTGNDKPLHVHTLAGMAHINFRSKEMMSYDKFFRTTLAITNDYTQLEEVYRRMVFNVLFGNQDDHAKNHSYVMAKNGAWSLSPAYDISPTFGHGHQMEINFKDKGVTHDDLLVMAERFNIANPRDIIMQQIDVMHDFERLSKVYALPQKNIETIMKNFKMSG